MRNIVFFCIPAHGHVNPTLGVVRTLTAQGHRVTYYSYAAMREKIERAGAMFVPCDAYDPQVRLSAEDGARLGRDLAFSTELIVQLTLALDDALLRDMERMKPDVIVGDSMAFWAKLIAQKLGVPFVSSTTTFAFNRYSAREMKQQGPGLLGLLAGLPKINRSLARLRDKGYAVKSVLDIIANDNDTSTLVYTSKLFQPFVDTFSERYAFVGPILRDAETTLERADVPTVYISLGTVNNRHPDFYRNCLRAMAGEPVRAILSVGEGGEADGDSDVPGDVPPNCIVRKSVDQMAVLACADAFLTHCGMNSVSEALYHDVPLVLFPQTPEQQCVAKRVEALHAGCFLKETTPEAIRAALDAALHDAALRQGAQAIGQSLRACGGAEEAARFILRQAR